MTKRARFILFWSCLIFFSATAPLVVLYSQGYRIDFSPPTGGKIFTQTGGIFLKINPHQADIYLDDKLIKKTDFFFGSILIENLLPKHYKVQIKKEGYLPWEKTFQVKEKEVVEAKFISLILAKNDFKTIAQKAENFWPSPDGKKIILLEQDSQSWALKLYDTEKNLKSSLLAEKDITQKGASILNLDFAQDSKQIYLDVGTREQEKNFLLKIDKVPPLLTERKVEAIPDDVLASYQGYHLDSRGFVIRNSDNFKLNQIPFSVQPETEYKLRIFNNFTFLGEGEALYLLNGESNSFERIFEKVKDLIISPDEKTLAIFSDSELWLFFLSDISEQPNRKAGQKLFLMRLSEKIDNVLWLNDYYLAFNSGNNVKIAEVDERDRIQTWDIANFPNPKIVLNEIKKKLYILSQNTLYESQTF